MRNATVWRQSRTEAESREQLVRVVVLNDLSDRAQRSLVEVGRVRVVVVQRCRLVGIAVRRGEVDAHSAVDLTPARTQNIRFKKKNHSKHGQERLVSSPATNVVEECVRLTNVAAHQLNLQILKDALTRVESEQQNVNILYMYNVFVYSYHSRVLIFLPLLGLLLSIDALQQSEVIRICGNIAYVFELSSLQNLVVVLRSRSLLQLSNRRREDPDQIMSEARKTLKST